MGNQSLVVLLDKFEVFVERNPSAVIDVDFVEVPSNHLFCNGDLKGLESVFHQLCELVDVDEIILLVLDIGLSIFCPAFKEVRELNYPIFTYYSKVIFPSLFLSILWKCQSSWSCVISF